MPKSPDRVPRTSRIDALHITDIVNVCVLLVAVIFNLIYGYVYESNIRGVLFE